MSDESIRIGVIGGSGLYRMPDLLDIQELEPDTPFGPPSDSIVAGTLNGVRVAFLPRHGTPHDSPLFPSSGAVQPCSDGLRAGTAGGKSSLEAG